MVGWLLFQTATALSMPLTQDQKLRWITGPLADVAAADVAGADAAVEDVAAEVAAAEVATAAAEVGAVDVDPAAEVLVVAEDVLLDEPQATRPNAVIARPLATRRRTAVCL